MRRAARPAAALAAMLATGPAAADGVADICAEDGALPDICACAAQGLAGEFGVDDYALYHRVGWDYARLRERGAAEGAAWESAVRAEIARADSPPDATRLRADAARRAHRAHIRQCRRLAG